MTYVIMIIWYDISIDLLTLCWPGPLCLNVVDIEIGGTTAIEFHCSGSWPAWRASVLKWGKGLKSAMLSLSLVAPLLAERSDHVLNESIRCVRTRLWRKLGIGTVTVTLVNVLERMKLSVSLFKSVRINIILLYFSKWLTFRMNMSWKRQHSKVQYPLMPYESITPRTHLRITPLVMQIHTSCHQWSCKNWGLSKRREVLDQSNFDNRLLGNKQRHYFSREKIVSLLSLSWSCLPKISRIKCLKV